MLLEVRILGTCFSGLPGGPSAISDALTVAGSLQDGNAVICWALAFMTMFPRCLSRQYSVGQGVLVFCTSKIIFLISTKTITPTVGELFKRIYRERAQPSRGRKKRESEIVRVNTMAALQWRSRYAGQYNGGISMES